MTEPHWIGGPPDNDYPDAWCIVCDVECTDVYGDRPLLECEYCGKDCCATCSEHSTMGIICIVCIEEGEEE